MDRRTSIAIISGVGAVIIGLLLFFYFSDRPAGIGKPKDIIDVVIPKDDKGEDTNSGTNGSDSEGDNNGEDTDKPDETPQYKSLKITNPSPNETISSPLKVTGEAAGWYFEATFPIRLEDNNGNKIAESYVTAKGDWMTTGFVPFEGELTFTVPAGVIEGKLIFEKSNPSDLPQNADSISIPVKFAQKMTEVSLFFSNSQKDPGMADCSRVYMVKRSVPAIQAIARAALEELLKGPTEEEKSKGYFSSIPGGVIIQSLSISNKTAFVDFNSKIETAGSCKVAAILSQVNETLNQFDTVDKVVISVDRKTEGVLQP